MQPLPFRKSEDWIVHNLDGLTDRINLALGSAAKQDYATTSRPTNKDYKTTAQLHYVVHGALIVEKMLPDDIVFAPFNPEIWMDVCFKKDYEYMLLFDLVADSAGD
ncbi:hypothetical protein Fot_35283 [Forsythia ovata]|uniref:Uncharacterized protein n=1 Tax=Forsythia ovata TaxID=205694 RepID=A0ABD1SLC7_9LAMI